MSEKEFEIKDESNDRRYFTVVPNYILNHSSAVAQALYLQLKRLAGENGLAYPTARYLMKQLKISHPTLRKEMKYLLEKGWIEDAGEKEIETKGGKQKIKAYKIVDLWKLNCSYYDNHRGEKIATPCGQRGEKIATQGVKKEEPKKNHIYKEKPIYISSKEDRKNSPASYGNGDVNYLIRRFKEITGLSKLDGSEKQNRRYCWLLLKKVGDLKKVENLIKIAAQGSFHKVNLTSFKYLYYNCVKIAVEFKEKMENPVYAKIK